MKTIHAVVGAAMIGTSMIVATALTPSRAEQSIEWDDRSKVAAISCGAIGGLKFTLDTNQRPTSQELPSLCSCLAKETNQKGWEVETLNKLTAGEDVGFIMKEGAMARFGKAVDSCSVGKYYISDKNPIDESASQNDGVSLFSQRFLGFLGGGPIGVLLAPWAYNFFGKNLILWIIVGVVGGGFLWQISIVAFFRVLSLLSSLIKPSKSDN